MYGRNSGERSEKVKIILSLNHILIFPKLQINLKRFIRSPKDPEHIANRQNAFGQTALYLAAKNGNLNV